MYIIFSSSISSKIGVSDISIVVDVSFSRKERKKEERYVIRREN